MKGQMQWMRLMMMWNDCEEDGCVRRTTVKGMGMLGVNMREMEGTDDADGDNDTDW